MPTLTTKFGAVYKCDSYERVMIGKKSYYKMKNVVWRKEAKDGKIMNGNYKTATMSVKYNRMVD